MRLLLSIGSPSPCPSDGAARKGVSDILRRGSCLLRWNGSAVDEGLTQLADAFDLAGQHLAGPQPALWFAPEADPGRRAGEHDVARFEGGDRGQPGDQLRDGEQQVAG